MAQTLMSRRQASRSDLNSSGASMRGLGFSNLGWVRGVLGFWE